MVGEDANGNIAAQLFVMILTTLDGFDTVIFRVIVIKKSSEYKVT